MRKFSKILSATLIFVIAIMLSSCTVTKKATIIPAAVSSISNPVSLEFLNLTKDSYQIINTETVESVIVYEEKGLGSSKTIKISEKNDEYALEFKKNSTTGEYDIKYSGIVKIGYLSDDDRTVPIDKPFPALFARGLAAYRLINSVQDQGADGIIEPIVTMKVGQEGKKIIFTTTISAKLIKIKSK